MKRVFIISIMILIVIGCSSKKEKEDEVQNIKTDKEIILKKYEIKEKDEVINGINSIIRLDYFGTIENYKIYYLFTKNVMLNEVEMGMCDNNYYYVLQDHTFISKSYSGIYFIRDSEPLTFEEIIDKDLIIDKVGLFNLLKDKYGYKNSDGTYLECKYENGNWIKKPY